MWLASKKWQAEVALALVATLVVGDAGGLLGGIARAQQAAAKERRLALFVVPKTPKDATAAVVMKGLLRGAADRLLTQGIARAHTSPCADPSAPATVAAKVEEGRAALASQKWADAYNAFVAADNALQMCLGGTDRTIVARCYKGLGVAALMTKQPPSEPREAIRRSLVLWPGQKVSEYGYSPEARNLFLSVQREIEEAQTGVLAVNTIPVHGEVYVDYEFRGFGPVKVAGLPVGTHLVTVYQDGYLLWSQFVDVRGGTEQPLEVTTSQAPFRAAVESTVADALKASAAGKGADAELERLGKMTGATDVVVLAVAMDARGFTLEGFSWTTGQAGKAIRRTLAKDATLVTAAQGVLGEAIGVPIPPEAPLAALEPAPVSVPAAGGAGAAPIGDEEYIIDPNSPIFRDAGKKAEKKSVFKQWWFWTAAGVVVGGAVAGIVVLSRRSGEGGGPTGSVQINLNGVQ